MLREILLRMIIGGLFVSALALVSDVIKVKRFAGLFGAAPSVALATLALTARTQGKDCAAMETRSMIAGAVPPRRNRAGYSYHFVCRSTEKLN